jgi:hypothetical protein
LRNRQLCSYSRTSHHFMEPESPLLCSQVPSTGLYPEPFSRNRQLCSYSRTSQHFMEPEGPLSCSQVPSTGPYPEPFSRNRQLCSYSRTSQHFMEPEGLLSWSQVPSTDPYPEPDQSIPSHSISLRSILILYTHPRLGLPNGLFPSVFPTNILYAFLFAPFVLHALPIPSS